MVTIAVAEKPTKRSIVAALKRISRGMRAGLYREVDYYETQPKRGVRNFNMGMVAEKSACGTVCCIGGWLGFELGAKNTSQARYNMSRAIDRMPKLNHLFFEGTNNHDPLVAAKRIDKFLAKL